MANATTMERLARFLTMTGIALLAAGLLAVVWAMFFTEGSEVFLSALTVIGLASVFPSAVVLMTAWAVNSSDFPAEESAPEDEVEATPPAATSSRALSLLATYGTPLVATSLAASSRWWLDTYLGGSIAYATFLLAVAAVRKVLV